MTFSRIPRGICTRASQQDSCALLALATLTWTLDHAQGPNQTEKRTHQNARSRSPRNTRSAVISQPPDTAISNRLQPKIQPNSTAKLMHNSMHKNAQFCTTHHQKSTTYNHPPIPQATKRTHQPTAQKRENEANVPASKEAQHQPPKPRRHAPQKPNQSNPIPIPAPASQNHSAILFLSCSPLPPTCTTTTTGRITRAGTRTASVFSPSKSPPHPAGFSIFET